MHHFFPKIEKRQKQKVEGRSGGHCNIEVKERIDSQGRETEKNGEEGG